MNMIVLLWVIFLLYLAVSAWRSGNPAAVLNRYVAVSLALLVGATLITWLVWEMVPRWAKSNIEGSSGSVLVGLAGQELALVNHLWRQEEEAPALVATPAPPAPTGDGAVE